ncbi:hypothetical protein COY27_05975 [Candidatus Woesearchaeota archaeon CG_4_10_14_0_2_um_filter_33_13]|nr:MAG: hypothetical protein COY27_05975 [Candidatus Woesearchaeota archaeon CG_4_10_14_0_2_um_filter_33_13]
MLKKLLSKFKRKEEKKYPNRFLKFYYENQQRLNKERRSTYTEKKDAGICVRCNKKALSGIVFCDYHQKKQINYNKKARLK